MRSAIEVPKDHPAFAGHFPKFPVLPGAVLLDAALQVIQRERGIDLTQWQVASVKFLGVVRPGDALCLEHEIRKSGLIRFSVRVAGCVPTGTSTLCFALSSAARQPGAGRILPIEIYSTIFCFTQGIASTQIAHGRNTIIETVSTLCAGSWLELLFSFGIGILSADFNDKFRVRTCQ